MYQHKQSSFAADRSTHTEIITASLTVAKEFVRLIVLRIMAHLRIELCLQTGDLNNHHQYQE
jgi:hypothetical protein